MPEDEPDRRDDVRTSSSHRHGTVNAFVFLSLAFGDLEVAVSQRVRSVFVCCGGMGWGEDTPRA
eukprot:m.136025 g.136025  ORF g.136025 m.136025 type:complete len:64 (+) comp11426_c7_seq1:106-297(+)